MTPSLISTTDRALLSQNNVHVKINPMESSGIIIINNKNFKFSIWDKQQANDTSRLTEEQFTKAVEKIAVMMLKKELCQNQKANSSLFRCTIAQEGFIFSTAPRIIKHEADEPRNTRHDYNALIRYLQEPFSEGNIIPCSKQNPIELIVPTNNVSPKCQVLQDTHLERSAPPVRLKRASLDPYPIVLDKRSLDINLRVSEQARSAFKLHRVKKRSLLVQRSRSAKKMPKPQEKVLDIKEQPMPSPKFPPLGMLQSWQEKTTLSKNLSTPLIHQVIQNTPFGFNGIFRNKTSGTFGLSPIGFLKPDSLHHKPSKSLRMEPPLPQKTPDNAPTRGTFWTFEQLRERIV